MTMGRLLYLYPDALLTHPKNLRRFYPENYVREMAESIKNAKGVYEPLLIVPNGKPGKYFVVDGNIRLAGGRLLGKDCPPLECKVMRQNEAEQLLTMIITAKFRYDPDPISEALHYKRLIDEEGYSPSKIARATGIAVTTVDNRLKLLTLEPEIQELIGNFKLPAGIGNLKIRLHRPIDWKNAKTVTVKHMASGDWYVSISVKQEITPTLKDNGKSTGVDVGLVNIVATSNENYISHPKFLRQSEEQLKKVQQKLSRSQKGSLNREKQR